MPRVRVSTVPYSYDDSFTVDGIKYVPATSLWDQRVWVRPMFQIRTDNATTSRRGIVTSLLKEDGPYQDEAEDYVKDGGRYDFD